MDKRDVKLGIIVPSGNTILEPEFYSFINNLNTRRYDISFHFGRIPQKADTIEELENMVIGLDQEVQKLKDAEVDAIGFGCTAGSFLKGESYNKSLEVKMEKISKVQCTTASSSVIKAIKTLKLKKISILSPYSSEINRRLINFMEYHNIYVENIKGLNLVFDSEKMEEDEIFRIIKKEQLQRNVEGIFISCTDFKGSKVIHSIEKEFEIPAITSNQALLWNLFKLVKIKVKIQNYGMLFKI